MSRTIDLFIDSDQPIEQLAAQIGDLTGLPLTATPDRGRFVLQDGPVLAYLVEHDFLDDDGLPLSEFRFVLSAAVRGGTSLDDSREVTALRRVNSLLRASSSLPSLLVIDLERPDQLQDPVL